MYRAFYRLLLSHVDAERAHRFGVVTLGRGAAVMRTMRGLGLVARPHPDGAVEAMGIRFPAPVGLAAGMDKDAEAVAGLAAAGFGFVEVGTVTPKGQPGNEKPRSWREKDLRALRNRMGFNNGGADAMAVRLAALRASGDGSGLVVGVNLGKNKTTSPEDAAADYAYSARVLAPYADYLVVNVSSPNTPGLRDLQSVETLRPILAATREAALHAVPERRVPLLVKIAPDLADQDVDAVADLALELGLDGIVAANTTIGHDRGPGGLSGPTLLPRALEIVSRLRGRVGPDLCLIGVGGVSSVDDARAMLRAGATLVQVYTAFVYQGPGWVARMNRELTAA